MLFDLKSVFLNEGTTKEVKYKLDISDIELDGIFPFTSPVEVTAAAHNRTGLVTLELKCVYSFARQCDRCSAEVAGVEAKLFSHKLVQNLVDDSNDDYIETPDFTLELDEIVTSDLVLSYPQKFLCHDDCKGLCPKCGKNLNEGECDCGKRVVDPRLEVLKQLMDD